MSFITVTKEQCACCVETMDIYHIPLPMDGVTYNFPDNFVLHLDREELQTLYLEIKGHLMGLTDVQPVED